MNCNKLDQKLYKSKIPIKYFHNTDNLSIFPMNIRSMQSYFNELKDYLTSTVYLLLVWVKLGHHHKTLIFSTMISVILSMICERTFQEMESVSLLIIIYHISSEMTQNLLTQTLTNYLQKDGSVFTRENCCFEPP